MLNLYLMRHGESDWSSFDGNDKNRKINQTGIRRNHSVGSFISKNKINVEKILCSSAERTQETMNIIINYFSQKPKVEISNLMYKCNAAELLDIIKSQPSNLARILVIGHQPYLSEIIELLSSDKSNYFFQEATLNFNSSSVLKFTFDTTSWEEINNTNSKIDFFFNAEN